MSNTSLDDKFDKLFEVCRETLAEIKKMGSMQEVRLQQHDKEFERVWAAIERAGEARKDIYERLERIDQKCAAYHGINGAPSHTGNNRRVTDQQGNVIEAWIGKKFYLALSIVLGSMLGAVGIEIFKALLRR